MKNTAERLFDSIDKLEEKLGLITFLAIVRPKDSPRYWDILVHPDSKPASEIDYTKSFVSSIRDYLGKDINHISKVVVLDDNDAFYKEFSERLNTGDLSSYIRNRLVHGVPLSRGYVFWSLGSKGGGFANFHDTKPRLSPLPAVLSISDAIKAGEKTQTIKQLTSKKKEKAPKKRISGLS